jgi:MFS transporter, SP family, solute carrier family 2 (myo-inositol transporter), member 13
MSEIAVQSKVGYNRLLLFVAGLGGLLYGVDVGIISGALPYLETTSNLNPNQLSFIVAAVLLGSVISTLFAGLLADWMGRRSLMIVSGVMFVVSIPTISLSHGYEPLILGRLLQGTSAGFIGVVVPLYLAECLGASNRGKGTGFFQWFLTLGLVLAAVVSTYFSYRVDSVAQLGDAAQLFAFKDHAWRSIFWFSLPPGILFVLGTFLVAESPRWLFRRGNQEAAHAALLRSRSDEQAARELKEMREIAQAEKAKTSAGSQIKESLLKRKYVIPFVLACIVLGFNQLTGVNSIISYNTTTLLQGGLTDVQAHWGSLFFSVTNFLSTIVGLALVDRKGRKFLLSLGTGGIILSVLGTGVLFHNTEKQQVDVKNALQSMVSSNQTLHLSFNQKTADQLLASTGEAGKAISNRPESLVIIYSYGDFRSASNVVRTSDDAGKSIEIKRTLPGSQVEALFSSSSPFGDLSTARTAPLKIENALISPVPSQTNGWLVALTLYLFMFFYALGPGVVVWLALSELMPTRIRSNGMSIALLINQAFSTTIAAIFLPVVGQHGYSTMFFGFAACTVVYFVTAVFFLPETKGKTLEQIEEYFEGIRTDSELAPAK